MVNDFPHFVVLPKAFWSISFEMTLGPHEEKSNRMLSHVNPRAFMWPKHIAKVHGPKAAQKHVKRSLPRKPKLESNSHTSHFMVQQLR
jgi:hypothetical protein